MRDLSKEGIARQKQPDKNEFLKELTSLINKHNLESLCNTPDFIIAEYLVECLANYAYTLQECGKWHQANMLIRGNEN